MTLAVPVRRSTGRSDRRQTGPQLTTATVFAALASDLSTASGLDQVFGEVLEFAVTGVHCDWATITLLPTKRWAATTVTSDPRVAQSDITQPVDEHGTTRPGPVGVHVVELAVGRTAFGAIAYYAARPDRLSAADTVTARLLAVHAALAIMTVRTAPQRNWRRRSTPAP